MKISVIVATYNRPDALDLVLQSLACQNDENFEVIVADDGSRAETAELVAAWQVRYGHRLLHVWQEDDGFRLARIRNLATSRASGEYLIYLDGDCIVQPDFIRRHRALAAPGNMVTGGRILLERGLTEDLCGHRVWDFKEFRRKAVGYWLQRQLNKWLPLWMKFGDSGCRLYPTFKWRRIKGCNMAAWRHDVLRIGGFDEEIRGWGHEDADFVFRLFDAGIQRKSGSWATEVLHLWHQQADKRDAERNAALVREKILAKAKWQRQPKRCG